VAERGEAQRQEGTQRTPVYRQLWFWVVIAIVAGIIFGLVAQDAALKAQWLAEAFIR
jgi:aerobic C4-dicarboxylate transport protein